MKSRSWDYSNPQVRYWYTGGYGGVQATIIISRHVKLLNNDASDAEVLESIKNSQDALQFFVHVYTRKPHLCQWEIIHRWCREFDDCRKNCPHHIRTKEEYAFRKSVILPPKNWRKK